jgi:hypothetical protein
LSRESRRDSWSADRSSERSSRPRSRSPDRSASRSLQLQDDLREPARSHRIQAVVRDSPRIDERAMKVERGFDWYAPPRRLNVIQHGENGRSLVVDSKVHCLMLCISTCKYVLISTVYAFLSIGS